MKHSRKFWLFHRARVLRQIRRKVPGFFASFAHTHAFALEISGEPQ